MTTKYKIGETPIMDIYLVPDDDLWAFGFVLKEPDSKNKTIPVFVDEPILLTTAELIRAARLAEQHEKV